MSDAPVAIVTAGGSGMGAAAAGRGEALAAELGGFGVTGSNRSPDDLQHLVDETLARWGRIDAVVNSAGHAPKGPLLEMAGLGPQSGTRDAPSTGTSPTEAASAPAPSIMRPSSPVRAPHDATPNARTAPHQALATAWVGTPRAYRRCTVRASLWAIG